MLMSKSRLEKFLYALYSLDYSDLPTPPSRIEKLYNCLVTGGEVPTFKPLSRVEKYLMAILGVYNVDELPNPLSRVEVLLYKLATGDDNLDDVKSFLSEHEELLAEIIRNGGAGGNIDIEYVLYTLSTEFNTLYNTAEKPVKSAILKGQTLVNLSNISSSDIISINNILLDISLRFKLKNLTTYTAIFNAVTLESPNDSWCGFIGNNGWGSDVKTYKIGINKIAFTILENNDCGRFRLRGTNNAFKNLIILEGDYTNVDIPYFDGMQSVKMPVLTTVGKNLFDGKLEYGMINGSNGQLYETNNFVRTSNYIPVNSDKITYTIFNEECGLAVYFYDIENNFILHDSSSQTTYTFSVPSGAKYMKFRTYTTSDKLNQIITNNLNTQIQLEEGSTATPYEPYKSNILTVNEEVELRGIGEVKDELNLLTGELTQRIGEIVLDGSEETIYSHQTTDTETLRFFISCFGYDINVNTNVPFLTNSNLPNGSVYDIDEEGIFSSWGGLYIRISKTRLMENSVKGLKNYLQSNPITVQYQLAKNTIKTVDLSVVNQDGNNTKISTFNDITYVTLSSEGIIPEAELKVATKNKEVLSTMSLEMNDISTTQNALQETSDIQYENIDATMIATTEIYEGLL